MQCNTHVILGQSFIHFMKTSLCFSSIIVDGNRFVSPTALGHRQFIRIFLDTAVGSNTCSQNIKKNTFTPSRINSINLSFDPLLFQSCQYFFYVLLFVSVFLKFSCWTVPAVLCKTEKTNCNPYRHIPCVANHCCFTCHISWSHR